MSVSKEKQDKSFPLFAHDNPLRRLFWPPRRLTEPYVRKGQTAADLGCGPGFCTLTLAEFVGPEGKVYAVDVDEKAVRELERKAAKRGYRNIEARASSASDLSFIKDGSIDFVLAHGLLCSMAPKQHEAAVSEMKRILGPHGLAYVSVASGPWSYVGRAEWEKILEGFEVEQRSDGFLGLANRWAVVSRKRT
ncbi:MAG: class I SAM-dependent methyltransferase [Candidatus Aminicenantes bacterium]|nr:class I SAM-dependent methyltransferase [Candidatus Aminicenantes bacterium]